MTALLLAGLHWILLFLVAGFTFLGQMGGLQGDVPITPAVVAQRAAMKPCTAFAERVIECVFSILSWPGPSAIREPNRYDPPNTVSIPADLFWGSVPCVIVLFVRRIRRHADQPTVA
jgi:hypothetical protein